MPRIRFLVSGDVQGVGFRFFTLDRARSLGLSGWVRNRWDGKVEGEVEGPEGTLAEFGRELRRGPVSAQVDAVQIHEIPALGGPSVFKVEP
jgi:acylphosphatase